MQMPRFIVFLLSTLLFACNDTGKNTPSETQVSSQQSSAIPVTLVNENGKYQLYRQGKPYFIRGGGGSRNLELLAASGGNSLRTWDTNYAAKTLDEAQKLGLTVMLGLRLGIERHGFDYNDAAAVAAQKQAVIAEVMKYKDHPALLVWGVGNELDLFYTNTNMWYAVEDIVKTIKSLDPNHLVTVVTAGVDAEKVRLIKERVPSIDYLSVNVYGELGTLPQTLLEYGWDGAYAVTEWGPTGHWQITKTAWDVPIEQTSTEKAQSYLERYQAGILGSPEKALGSYAFYWSQKQETTPTWYGLFLESGESTEAVDTLEYLWTGKWPHDRAPSIRSFIIDGKKATENIYLDAGKTYQVKLDAFHPNQEEFQIRWEILPESTDIGAGGDAETRPTAVTGLIVRDNGQGEMAFTAPAKSGPYRLFTYVTNKYNRAATANIPFYVR